jgi:hypothetical protein
MRATTNRAGAHCTAELPVTRPPCARKLANERHAKRHSCPSKAKRPLNDPPKTATVTADIRNGSPPTDEGGTRTPSAVPQTPHCSSSSAAAGKGKPERNGTHISHRKVTKTATDDLSPPHVVSAQSRRVTSACGSTVFRGERNARQSKRASCVSPKSTLWRQSLRLLV